MAVFTTKTFTEHDDYMTPEYAWENIQHLIPNNKVIWECFYGDGKSGEYLTDLGFDVIHEDIDFFQNNLGDIIVSNPPFSKIKQVIERLAELEKPFIIILPASKICTGYFREFFKNKIQIIIPRKRIHFNKLINGQDVSNKSSSNFDCFYYCYQMEFDKDIIWLD